MSEMASTGAPSRSATTDDPASGPAPLVPHGGRRFARTRPKRRWQNNLWNSTPPSVLVDEAARLTAEGDRRKALRLLAVAATTTEEPINRHAVLARLAVTAADAGRHNVSADAVFELQQATPRTADLWVTFAEVALSRGNYGHADRAARSALELDPDHQGAWAALAAGYAGLGWFEDADSCLKRIDRTTLTDLQRWRIGRAVNRWSLTKTRWVAMTAISAIVVGVLAVAVAVSIPFVTREFRLRALRDAEQSSTFEEFAAEAWRSEHRLRVGHAAVVLLSVLTFVAATIAA